MRPPAENPKLCVEWFKDLWLDVCLLRDRYLLPIRSRWWENPVQVEGLAAFSAWVERYDSGEWDDPPGKLGKLFGHDLLIQRQIPAWAENMGKMLLANLAGYLLAVDDVPAAGHAAREAIRELAASAPRTESTTRNPAS